LAAALLPCFAGLLAASQALAEPAQVLLVRHGHKTPGGSTYNLSPEGLQRALALAALIPACFGKPDQIHAFGLDLATNKNARSYQTAVPLAVATGITIQIDAESTARSREIGEQILNSRANSGANIVMFWEHRHLPELAAGLGWPSMRPIADDNFDQLFLLDYNGSARPPRVSVYSQQDLLQGLKPCKSFGVAPLSPRRSDP